MYVSTSSNVLKYAFIERKKKNKRMENQIITDAIVYFA